MEFLQFNWEFEEEETKWKSKRGEEEVQKGFILMDCGGDSQIYLNLCSHQNYNIQLVQYLTKLQAYIYF